MNIKNLESSLKKMGHEVKKVSLNRLVIVTNNDRISTLREISKKLKGTYVARSSVSSAGIVNFPNRLSVFAKPKKGGGSGAGAALTKLAESAQCLYCAAAWEGRDYTSEGLSSSFKLVDIDEKLQKILKDLPEDWVKSSIMIAESLRSRFGFKKYKFHRGSSWVESLEKHWAKLNKTDKKFSNINKWSPADIYLLTEKGESVDFKKTNNFVELNSLFLENFSSGDIIGVSLKKVVGTVNLQPKNVGNPSEYEYKGYTLGKRGFFESKDVYIMHEKGEIQFRTFPTWQGEIKGEFANQGKISGGPIAGIVKKIVGVDLIPQREVRREFLTEKMHEYYVDLGGRAIPKNDFLASVGKKDEDWFVSKFLGLQLLYHMTKSKMEKRIVSSMLGYASSESELSGPYIKAM